MATATATITANIHPDTDEVRKLARIVDGPHTGAGFLLYNPRAASMGDRVTVEYEPDDQYCRVLPPVAAMRPVQAMPRSVACIDDSDGMLVPVPFSAEIARCGR